ncbi:MAG TPA: tRNA adenosine(34) deaminase TadA [Chlamydiales bacterium]|nr:tRNA adenosine(34) deaminase TadA [Chlamydiales bacterium]
MATPADKTFMKEALKEALKAYEEDEVPVGAVLVYEGRIIARGHNQVEKLQDGTAHAEMLCLSAAAGTLSSWRLTDATLYCTLEPCPMCAGALFATRCKRLVWGAPDIRVGANGSWVNLFIHKHAIHTVEVVSGVLADEAAFLMQRFFQEKRKRRDE